MQTESTLTIVVSESVFKLIKEHGKRELRKPVDALWSAKLSESAIGTYKEVYISLGAGPDKPFIRAMFAGVEKEPTGLFVIKFGHILQAGNL